MLAASYSSYRHGPAAESAVSLGVVKALTKCQVDMAIKAN